MESLDVIKSKLQEADEIREWLAELSHPSATPTSSTQTHALIGRRVIVRTYISGVSIGVLAALSTSEAGFEAHLTDAIRLWKWTGAFTLSEIATVGSATARIAKHPSEGVWMADRGMEILPISDAAFQKTMSGAVEGAE